METLTAEQVTAIAHANRLRFEAETIELERRATAAANAHMHEVRRWLGLVRFEAPEGLHAERRGMLMARHARVAKPTRKRPGDNAPQPVYSPNPMLLHISGRPYMVMPSDDWRRVDDALVATYDRHREKHVMALLRPQRLDDRLWRGVYAVMVRGGPVLLPDLVTFVARLTGPREVAQEEALARAQRWQATTRE